LSEHEAILFANTAFYAAFAGRDVEAMEGVWAKDRPISCIHPGWRALAGRDAVMKSWRGILSNPQAPLIVCKAEQVSLYGDMAIVMCLEQITISSAPNFLIATNVFAKNGALWALVHHQAGAVHVDPGTIVEAPKLPMN